MGTPNLSSGEAEVWQTACPLLDAMAQGPAYAHRWKPCRKGIQGIHIQQEKAGKGVLFQNSCPHTGTDPPREAANSLHGTTGLI